MYVRTAPRPLGVDYVTPGDEIAVYPVDSAERWRALDSMRYADAAYVRWWLVVNTSVRDSIVYALPDTPRSRNDSDGPAALVVERGEDVIIRQRVAVLPENVVGRTDQAVRDIVHLLNSRPFDTNTEGHPDTGGITARVHADQQARALATVDTVRLPVARGVAGIPMGRHAVPTDAMQWERS